MSICMFVYVKKSIHVHTQWQHKQDKTNDEKETVSAMIIILQRW